MTQAQYDVILGLRHIWYLPMDSIELRLGEASTKLAVKVLAYRLSRQLYFKRFHTQNQFILSTEKDLVEMARSTFQEAILAIGPNLKIPEYYEKICKVIKKTTSETVKESDEFSQKLVLKDIMTELNKAMASLS